MTTRTQKSTKVTDEERFERLGDMRTEIRNLDPNLSNKEVDRRAHEAVGLPFGDDVDLDDVPKGGRGRAAARATGRGAKKAGRATSRGVEKLTTSGARKTIFFVMGLSLGLGIVRDIRSGDATSTDVVPRRIIGTLVGSLLLMVLAGPAPQVARGLAFLVGFAVVGLNTETIGRVSSALGFRPEPKPGIGFRDDGDTTVVGAKPGTPGGVPQPESRDNRLDTVVGAAPGTPGGIPVTN